MTKVAIVGAGAIGCLLTARLSATDAEVTLVARPASAKVIGRDGITMTTPAGETIHTAVNVTDDASSVGPQDIVLLCVKAHALTGALDTLAPLMGPETTVVPMINGIPWWYPLGQEEPLGSYRLQTVDPGGRLWDAIPSESLVGAVIWVSVEGEGVGRIRHVDEQRFVFGDPFGRRTRAVEEVASLFNAADFEGVISTDIRSDIWVKLWGNLAFNPLSALTGSALGPLCADPGTRSVARTMMAEAKAIAEHFGVRFTTDIETRLNKAQSVGGYRTSMLQDMEAGRALEVDAIVRSVAELGALAGIATPTIDAVASLVEMKARQRDREAGGRSTATASLKEYK